MKALIVYASWFGHNRAAARIAAAELARRGFSVSGAPADRVSAADIAGYDVLVLGTYTHGGRASQRLRALCESIPLRTFDHVEVALFGTQTGQDGQHRMPGGVRELEECLAERGVELALPPLLIRLSRAEAYLPWLEISPAERRRIEEFADDLWEASVPEPMIYS